MRIRLLAYKGVAKHSRHSPFKGEQEGKQKQRDRASSIVNGGIGTKCAENPTRKKCAKFPRSNISGMPRSNSQGQIFQECQGQIFQECQGQIFQECQGQIPKVKYFRNAKVKFPRSNISGMPRSNGNKILYHKILKIL